MTLIKFFSAFIFLAFSTSISAQSVQFPNELKGYEFFGDGKLKELQLGVSSNYDVAKIFGEECSGLCDYDDDWRIKFHYFNNWTKTTEKEKYISSPEFFGKIWIVELFPKKSISYSEMTFSNLFKQTNEIITGQGFKSALKDSTGLSYVFESEVRICEPVKFENLLAIRYRVSDDTDKKAWILVQQKDSF